MWSSDTDTRAHSHSAAAAPPFSALPSEGPERVGPAVLSTRLRAGVRRLLAVELAAGAPAAIRREHGSDRRVQPTDSVGSAADGQEIELSQGREESPVSRRAYRTLRHQEVR